MKIPIFEEIILTNSSYQYLVTTLENSRVGKVPCYINLLAQKKTDLFTLIPVIEQVFLDLKLHPRFPYPTYLICELPQETTFPTVKSTKFLPDHFFKKVKRPNNKELQLLNKLGLKVEKLNNLDKNKILDDFKETSSPQKKLYNITKELYFLETLLEQLYEKPKKVNKK